MGPLWVPGTIEFIWAGGIPLKPHHKIFPPQNNFFRGHFLVPKRTPGQNVDLGIRNLILGIQNPILGSQRPILGTFPNHSNNDAQPILGKS